MRKPILFVIIAVILIAIAFVFYTYMTRGGAEELPLLDIVKNVKQRISISSNAFSNFSYIPKVYTCDGKDVSPPLTISNIPQNTKSLVLIVYDPDAPRGIFYHWIIYNIPPTISKIDDGIGAKGRGIIDIGLQGVNDFGYIGYGGPCPPPGSKHRYVFLVIALDKELNLGVGASANQVIEACRGHVLGYGILVGLYQR